MINLSIGLLGSSFVARSTHLPLAVQAMSKTGTVKNWNEEKGFGFIGQDDGGEDLFCHKSALSGTEFLDRGAKVRFDETWDDRKGKMRAANVSMSGGGGGHGGGGGYSNGRDSGYGGGDRYGGGRDDRDRGGRDDRDRDRGYGRDDRDRGGRDDRDRGGGRHEDREGGRGGGMQRFGGRNRGDDISEGGDRHVTARELFMQARGRDRRRDRQSRSRSSPRRKERSSKFA